jgi:hypothetical protein
MHEPHRLSAKIFIAVICAIVWSNHRAVAQPAETQTRGVAFSASPTVGPAPLTAFFNARGPRGVDIGAFVDFGDGQRGRIYPAPVCAICDLQATAGHVYHSAGQFTAALLNTADVAIAAVSVSVAAP